jgi:hypothetical protein
MRSMLAIITLVVVAASVGAEPTYFIGGKVELRKAYDELKVTSSLSETNRDILIKALRNKYVPSKCRSRDLVKLNFEGDDVKNAIAQPPGANGFPP